MGIKERGGENDDKGEMGRNVDKKKEIWKGMNG